MALFIPKKKFTLAGFHYFHSHSEVAECDSEELSKQGKHFFSLKSYVQQHSTGVVA